MIRYRLLPLLLVLAPLHADEGRAASERLHAFLQQLDSLQANFQQVIYRDDASQGEASSGVLYVERPDHFRWDYRFPGQQQVIADGLSVWYYQPELEQASVQFQSLALRGTPAELLTSKRPVEELFELTDQPDHDGMSWVALKPLSEDPGYQEIELGFDQADLAAMRMVDNFGQTVWILLSELQRNPQLDPLLFRFDPPGGLDVFSP